jgi:hypothetical protein
METRVVADVGGLNIASRPFYIMLMCIKVNILYLSSNSANGEDSERLNIYEPLALVTENGTEISEVPGYGPSPYS